MDPALDPENQMRALGNATLIHYQRNYRCRILPARKYTELISDTGRAWRYARGIRKSVEGGVSTWTHE
jgi:hypothetical protein